MAKVTKAGTDSKFLALYDKARAAGLAAGGASKGGGAVVLTDGRKNFVLDDFPLGFAWVKVGGNTAFGKWAKKAGLARNGYPSGLHFWVSDFNQSMTRKGEYARAFAAVLNDAGVKASYDTRMD